MYNELVNKINFLSDFNQLGDTSAKLLADVFVPSEKVFIKIHFGEPGNKTAFTPVDVQPIIKVLKQLHLRPIFIDTPVAYDSPRNSVVGYSQVVKDKGYDQLAPFVISDTYVEYQTKDLTAQVAQELVTAKNVLVISHIKGHGCAGFGGAIKNFGMGGLSPKTKNDIHQGAHPKFISDCQGCGTCARLCPGHSITMVDNKATINHDTCLGCSLCQLVCPHRVLAPKVALFEDLLAQGASAVINHLPKNTFYINFLKNITWECDCWDDPGVIITPDIGILFGDNPVAIDKASVDLINQHSGRDLFRDTHHRDPLTHVNFATEYTKLSADYQLDTI